MRGLLGNQLWRMRNLRERKDRVELIRYFLSTGRLPWWVSQTRRSEPKLIDKSVQQLMDDSPLDMKTMMGSHMARKRLVFQCDESTVQLVLREELPSKS